MSLIVQRTMGMTPLVALLVASSVVLIASLLLPVLSIMGLIFSAISLFFIIVVYALKFKKPEQLAKKLFTVPKVDKDVTLELFLAILLVLTWIAGAFILTFMGPFTVTTNG